MLTGHFYDVATKNGALLRAIFALLNTNGRPVPYRSLLQEKIEPGQTLIVKGSTIDESQRFTINLHSKSADFSGNDVPLHISVRFDEGK
ncbi:hypothetical protein TELCIR_20475, partial [Teladorsagia circumcincta]